MSSAPRVRVRILRVGSCRHPEAIARRGASFRPCEFPALVGLLEHPTRGVFLFDTGYAPEFEQATRRWPACLYRWVTPVRLPPEQELLAQLARLGFAPTSIVGVFASHFHADHVAGLGCLPGARLFAARAALAEVRAHSRWSGVLRGLLPELLPRDLETRLVDVEACRPHPLPARLARLGTGRDLLGDGSVLAVPLPGHARGQFGLWVREQGGSELLFAADAAWSRRALLEQRLPAWPVRFLVDDWRTYARTFANLSALLRAHADLFVLPSHCLPSWRALPADLRVEA